MLLRSLVRWAALALAVAACDLPNPAGSLPTGVPAPSEPESRAEAALIGTYSVPTAMPLPDQVTSYARHAPTSLTLNPNSYVLLRVGGTLQAVRNPYILGTTPGEGPISYTAAESYAATARGATHLWLLGNGGSWAPPAGGEFLTGYFRPDPGDGRDMILLVRVGTTPTTVWSQRDRLPGKQLQGYYCFDSRPYCSYEEEGTFARPGEDNGKFVENYWLQQSHTITATAISEPLSVDGPDAVAPGGTATFTATPWGNLRLRNQVGILPRVWWIWYPSDTTAVPNPNVRAEVLFCRDQSCPFAPTVSGRLRVQTYVEGAPVDAERLVRVQQQRLELKCDRYSIVRGNTVQCSATAQPGGTLDSIRWAFTDGAGNPVGDSTGTASWGGTMVVGGRIAVTARLNSAPVAADTVLTITPRTWPRITVVAADSGNGELPQYPRVMHDLAHTHAPTSATPHNALVISTGPNSGWWYLASPTTQARAVVHISAGFKPGTPFYQLQKSGADPVTGDPFCSKGQMSQIERAARQHEGLVSSSLISHIEVYERWFRNNTPQDSLERLTAFQGSIPLGLTFSDLVDAAFERYVSTPAISDPNQNHTTGNAPGLVAFPAAPCRPRFF